MVKKELEGKRSGIMSRFFFKKYNRAVVFMEESSGSTP